MMDDQALLRYSRQILLPEVDIEGQERLHSSHALIIGAGGLGSPVALYLAAAGVGRITIADADHVELSNLQRQIAHQQASIGVNKAHSAQASMRALNPHCDITALDQHAEGAALERLVASADVVLDCTDRFSSRYAVNAASQKAGVPLISGAAIRFQGSWPSLTLAMPVVPATPACILLMRVVTKRSVVQRVASWRPWWA